MEDKKVLLSIKDLQVKFRVRGRILTAIRGVTLDIYENESIAIVGESGAGKSVFTKAFAGMLDSNGFIDQGDIIFNDAELSDTVVPLNSYAKKTIASTWEKLNEYSKLEYGSEVFLKMKALEQEKEEKMTLSRHSILPKKKRKSKRHLPRFPDWMERSRLCRKQKRKKSRHTNRLP